MGVVDEVSEYVWCGGWRPLLVKGGRTYGQYSTGLNRTIVCTSYVGEQYKQRVVHTEIDMEFQISLRGLLACCEQGLIGIGSLKAG